MACEAKKPFANPNAVFRREFDDWALLFDPDANNIFTLDPVSAFIWQRLDGSHTPQEILEELRRACDDVPEDALVQIDTFIQELEKSGLAGYEGIAAK